VRDAFFQAASRHEINPCIEELFQVPLAAGQAHQPDSCCDIDEKVDVALRCFFAAGHAAEDADVDEPMPLGDGSHLKAMAGEQLAQPVSTSLFAGLDFMKRNVEIETGSPDQTHQRGQGRLARPCLVRTHDALGNSGSPAQLNLRETSPKACIPKQRPRRHMHEL